jgi:hypothetical protein
MGTGIYIVALVFAWGVALIAVGALIETGWARLRRNRRKTLT